MVLPAWQRLHGQTAFQCLDALERWQWMSADELASLQWERVRRVVQHAATHVPYYADMMRRAGVTADELVSRRSLDPLPMMDRATITAERSRLRATNLPRERFVANGTGGSTGEPLRFFDDSAGDGWSTGALWRAQRWLGVDVGDRVAYIWGADFDLSRYRGAVGHMRKRLLNILMLPAWRMNAAEAHAIRDRLIAFQPRLVVGYAGAVHEFANFLGAGGAVIPGLHAIVVSAEVLTEDARAAIEACFRRPVFNRYGGRDIKFVAQECPDRRGLHINAENVFVEIIRDGGPAPATELGEIVITRLDNLAMPFIRYRTGDLGSTADHVCTCSRSLPLLAQIDGRTQDAIVCADGHVVSGLLFAHMFKDCPDVKLFQVHQLGVAHVCVWIVLARNGIAFESRPRVQRILRQHLGPHTRVDFDIRDSIPLTRSGKRRIVMSHVGLRKPEWEPTPSAP
jgi:phenylacetate-CoA ligase